MITKEQDFNECHECHNDNIYEDDGWWYCNGCGEVWEENNK